MRIDDIRLKYVTFFLNITSEDDNEFTFACRNKEDIDVIKYILKELKECKKNVNINHVTKDNENGFTLACRYGNIDMIKYFARELNIDIKHINNYAQNGLMVALINNNDINVIKYLVDELKLDVNCIDKYGNNIFLLACKYTQSVECIKYFVENLKIDTNVVNAIGHNGFTIACKHNTNINVMKYLVENINVNVLHNINHWCDNSWSDDVEYECDDDCNNTFGYCNHNGLKYACDYNENDEIIKYLIEIPDIIVKYIIDTKYWNIYFRLNKLKTPLMYLHSYEETIEFKNKICLIKQLIKKKMFGIVSHDKLIIKLYSTLTRTRDVITYKDMIDIIDYIDYKIEINSEVGYFLFNTYIENIDIFSKTNINELTFTVSYNYNGYDRSETVEYYGSKLILYNCINTFDILSQHGKEKDNGLHLVINQPKYIFDEYIIMHYTGVMNIKDWTLRDLMLFFDLIDMYPSKILDAKTLENHVINRLDSSCIDDEDNYATLRELCDKHELVNLLISLNNLKKSM
jgi:hypothetical protein